MKVKHTYKGKEIEIEFITTGERTDSPDDHYYCEFMDGFYDGHKMFQAIGEYEIGSDDLVEITDIEEADGMHGDYLIDLTVNEWGFFEATSTIDCDALGLTDKTIEGLKTQINEL